MGVVTVDQFSIIVQVCGIMKLKCPCEFELLPKHIQGIIFIPELNMTV